MKQLQNVTWNLHVMHWDESQKLLFINSSSKDFHERIAKEVGGTDHRVSGQEVFRALGGIKRLVLTNLGLSHAFGKNIRYTKFMGADIAEGLTETQKMNRKMSDVFGLGYEHAMVTVINDKGRRRKVLTYLAAPDYIDEKLKPYSWYKDFVLAGSVEHGLPAEYVTKYIESVEAIEDPNRARDKKQRATLGQ